MQSFPVIAVMVVVAITPVVVAAEIMVKMIQQRQGRCYSG
jgi:hypothetical protein